MFGGVSDDTLLSGYKANLLNDWLAHFGESIRCPFLTEGTKPTNHKGHLTSPTQSHDEHYGLYGLPVVKTLNTMSDIDDATYMIAFVFFFSFFFLLKYS